MLNQNVLRQEVFRRFFFGQTASLVGDQIAALAIPLTAILLLDAGPGQVGLLTAVALIPNLLFGLTVGAMVDRGGKRRQAMLWADVIRGIAVLSPPLACWIDVLTLQQLYIVAFVVGTFDVVFFVAYNALLVSIVKPAESISAASLLNGSRATSEVVGLSLGGALISLLTTPFALILNAVSFAYSALQLARIDAPEVPSSGGPGLHLLSGLAWISRNSVMRIILFSSGTMNFFAFITNAMLVIYASQTLQLDPTVIGIAFGVGAVGGVVGAATFGRIQARVGLGPAIAFASLAFPVASMLYPLARGDTLLASSVLAAGEFLSAVFVIWLTL